MMTHNEQAERRPHPPISRRDFLKLSSTGLAGAAALGTSGCVRRRSEGLTEIVFAFTPDDTGTLQPLIDTFNAAHADEIRVTYQTTTREVDDYFRRLLSDLEAGGNDVDVIAADVPWTAPLVSGGWVEDLSSRFYDVYNADEFLDAALNSAAYHFRIWGVPWYTDAGVLFYRKDLLEQSGFAAPPATWDELQEIAGRVMRQTDTRYGFVFQGAEYEGGVANALEYIWNAGGRVLTLNISVAGAPGQNIVDPNVITVNSQESAQGLEAARSMIETGIAPEAVTTFREIESWQAFLAGEAVFMRNWPNVYALLTDASQSQITSAQVGVAPIPSSASHGRYSCLGGWNLMINARSSNAKKEAAWTFIRYLTAPEQQRYRAINGSFLPTLRALYDDPEITDQQPIITLGREAVMSSRVRPVSPRYMEMSPRIARAFNRTLAGTITGAEAVANLERELRHIVEARGQRLG